MPQALQAQGARYLIVGCLNTAVGYGTFILGLRLMLPYLLALAVSHVIGVTHSYLWNRHWTFKAQGTHQEQLPRFLAVTGVMFAINAAMLHVLVQGGAPAWLAQLGCLFVTTVLGFVGHRWWSFKPASEA